MLRGLGLFGRRKMTWNERCLKSICNQRIEIEKKYGIKIGKTDIKCLKCGDKWSPENHECKKRRLSYKRSKNGNPQNKSGIVLDNPV